MENTGKARGENIGFLAFYAEVICGNFMKMRKLNVSEWFYFLFYKRNLR